MSDYAAPSGNSVNFSVTSDYVAPAGNAILFIDIVEGGNVVLPMFLVEGVASVHEVIHATGEFNLSALTSESYSGAYASLSLPALDYEAVAVHGSNAEFNLQPLEITGDLHIDYIWGDFSLKAPMISAEATYVAPIHSDGYVTLPQFSIEAEGIHGANGEYELPSFDILAWTGAYAEFTLPSLEYSGSAFWNLYISGAYELPSLQIAGYSGSIASYELPSFRVSASASVGHLAQGAYTLGALSVSATAHVDSILYGDYELPSLQVLALAHFAKHTVGNYTLPSLSISGRITKGIHAYGQFDFPEVFRVSSSAKSLLKDTNDGDYVLPALEISGYINNVSSVQPISYSRCQW